MQPANENGPGASVPPALTSAGLAGLRLSSLHRLATYTEDPENHQQEQRYAQQPGDDVSECAFVM